MDLLDEIVKCGCFLKKGEFLFCQGDFFGLVFVVCFGVLKIFSIIDVGEEQIIGFYLFSELVGLFGMDIEIYLVFVQVLEIILVCEIFFECLDELFEQLL